MKTTRSAARIAAALALAGICTGAGAQESRLATQALHCSAIFSVFEQTHADDEAQAKKYRRGVDIFTELYAKERGGDAGAAKAAAEQGRAALLKQFRDKLAEREPYLREDGVVCGAWAEGFFAQGDDWSFVPVYPKVIGMGARQQYAPIAAESFERWKR